MASGKGSKLGTGGMSTKIKAAEIATSFGVPTIIANGKEPNILYDIIDGNEIGTLFPACHTQLSTRMHWITFGSKKEGTVIIDSGAVTALQNHKSLLPVGIKSVKGVFHKNDVVTIVNEDDLPVAIGVTNFHSFEIEKILGKHSEEIKEILGANDYQEVVHIDNIYILKGERV